MKAVVPALFFAAAVLCSCCQLTLDDPSSGATWHWRRGKEKQRVVINPYGVVDFATASRVKAISHEHIFKKSHVKTAYDRGIRFFACVNYLPACPSYPLSNWEYEYEDYVSPNDLTLTKYTYKGSIPSFVDKDGNVVYTDDLVQLPNAEHTIYSNTSGMHFNVLGSTFGECGYGDRSTGEWSDEALGMKRTSWYAKHPKWDITDINSQYLNESHQLFHGKVFGTLNHVTSEPAVLKMLENCPGVFKAIEIVNQGSRPERWLQFQELWDKLLKKGYRIWGTSVVDWQRPGPDGNPRLGACNVLLINDYEGHSNLEKAEMGLDAYISGAYFPAGLADNDVICLSNDNESIRFEVTGHPTEMYVVTNLGKIKYTNTSSIDYSIDDKATYVRFEAWYRDESGGLRDYLFSNPVFIEYR